MLIELRDGSKIDGLTAFKIYVNLRNAVRENNEAEWRLIEKCYGSINKPVSYKIDNPKLAESVLKKYELITEEGEALFNVQQFITNYFLVTDVSLQTTWIFSERVLQQLNLEHNQEFPLLYTQAYGHPWERPSTFWQWISSCSIS